MTQQNKITTRTFKAGSFEWKETRCRYITGTEMPSLFGLNPYMNIRKLIQNKVEPVSIPDNKFMRAGRLFEPGVFVLMSEIDGLDARPASDWGTVKMYTDEVNRISVTLDGIATYNNKEYIVEAKSTHAGKFTSWVTGELPIGYLIQTQCQLLLSQTEQLFLTCVCTQDPFEMVIFLIEANKDMQKLFKNESRRFWECYANKQPFEINKKYKEYLINNLQKTHRQIY